ncbi:sigma-70 family RNA polymerase sigma factor [Reichenbachiella carrageenanivorans]|uniref:Sigma-70 family RNA polymerase sigma factor n=1 Tax=Reichenbachiella carrageenanivorans TaxID=2979869 RepID=A0ABY6CYS6_9BACT|nr:sigma-70 family RNA polymerase sigma factor [Reichenbachiella carrageenanivorans]UXX79076.1 sigma-70 family RNA polymerase sigma factor [Reichenbachiella carrageenanivorans]
MIDIDETWKLICVKKDKKSYDLFFDHFYPKLFNFSLSYVKCSLGAEEVVSDVFYSLLSDTKKQQEIKRVSAYLYISVKNKSLNWLRDRKRNLTIALDETTEYRLYDHTPFQHVKDRQVFDVLEEKVKELPAQRQMVYRLLREDGFYIDEVSELLGISHRTVEKHLELATKDLCLALKDFLQNQRHHPKIRKMFPRGLAQFF